MLFVIKALSLILDTFQGVVWLQSVTNMHWTKLTREIRKNCCFCYQNIMKNLLNLSSLRVLGLGWPWTQGVVITLIEVFLYNFLTLKLTWITIFYYVCTFSVIYMVSFYIFRGGSSLKGKSRKSKQSFQIDTKYFLWSKITGNFLRFF